MKNGYFRTPASTSGDFPQFLDYPKEKKKALGSSRRVFGLVETGEMGMPFTVPIVETTVLNYIYMEILFQRIASNLNPELIMSL